MTLQLTMPIRRFIGYKWGLISALLLVSFPVYGPYSSSHSLEAHVASRKQPHTVLAQDKATSTVLTNRDVLDMLKAGLTPEIVVAKIKSSECNFDTDPNTLTELKKASVPDGVILAMVQAHKTVSEVYVNCTSSEAKFPIRTASFYGSSTVAEVGCGDALESLGKEGFYAKVQTQQGVVGYIMEDYLSRTRPEIPKAEPASSASPVSTSSAQSHRLPEEHERTEERQTTVSLSPNTVRALSYRIIPQQQTTYYQSGQNSSYTNCYGQGQWFDYGSFGSLNMSTNCNTTYTSPTQIPITWSFADVYVLLETDTQRYVVGCRANWRWSNCSPLVPGDVFHAEVKGGQMWVTALKGGKKETRIKYSILQVARR